MLDFRFIKDNVELMRQNLNDRFMQGDPELVAALYQERNELLTAADGLRQKRNENARKMKGKLEQAERAALIEEGRKLKEEIAAGEEKSGELEKRLNEEAAKLPNLAHPKAPRGKEDKDNTELKRWGTPPQFSFRPKDHLELGLALDLFDFDTATKITGPKFYFLKNEAVFLELALSRYALDVLRRRGFVPMITPDLAKVEVVEGIGFNPRGAESNIYTVEETDLCLVGTAEITLGGYLSGQILEKKDLPVRYAGLSHCFRKEAGAYGQYSKGLYRVHQFSKVEMFVFCAPEESDGMHEELLAIEEEIFQGLGIPYRVVDTCTGSLGAPAYRKFDLEAWMPGRGEDGEWGEVTSTSNCTDFQSRRLNVRYREDKENRFVHMLNGTAVAVSRGIIALMENNQREDGSIAIPPNLIPYTGFSEITFQSKASKNLSF